MKILAGCLVLFAATTAFAQPGSRPSPDKPDSVMTARIIDEGMNHSQAMETISWLTDVCGGRLSMSANYKKAMAWTRKTLESYGVENVHFDGWGPWGKSWNLKRYSAHVIAPTVFPLISFPEAWSPGTDGDVHGQVVYFDAKTDSAIATYHGKLKGKFVLLGDLEKIKAHFDPEATRDADSTLLQMANADPDRPRGGRRFQLTGDARQRALMNYERMKMCEDEGVLAVLTPSRGDGGNVFVMGATVPVHPDTPFANRPRVYDRHVTVPFPEVVVGSEHYDRMIRMLQKGQTVSIEMNLDVEFPREDSAYNVIGEIPGSDLKDEVVMIGAHLDSWHGGTGATDNGTGVTTAIEAMRILKKLNVHPRRTIRIGLWCAEEQGLLGSGAYVKKHLGVTEGMGPDRKVTLTPEGEKFCAYFNDDNGTGKFRGVYMQGNEAMRPIFRAWLQPFGAMGASTLTPQNTGSTDHVSFDNVGLPGFQFIQDPIEYFPRTWHSTMDLYDRVQEEDLKTDAVIMASFAYDAAMRNEPLPRKSR